MVRKGFVVRLAQRPVVQADHASALLLELGSLDVQPWVVMAREDDPW
ncbi:hypothetical protein ACGFSB_18090 [Streptomyces sp. NPDC048441]